MAVVTPDVVTPDVVIQVAALVGAVAVVLFVAWRVGRVMERGEDTRLRHKALRAGWPAELEHQMTEDAYRGEPRQGRGAQRRILGGS